MEAAGIEPLLPTNPNPMMVNDFGSYFEKNGELPHRFFPFESPPVPWSLPQSWRYFADAFTRRQPIVNLDFELLSTT